MVYQHLWVTLHKFVLCFINWYNTFITECFKYSPIFLFLFNSSYIGILTFFKNFLSFFILFFKFLHLILELWKSYDLRLSCLRCKIGKLNFMNHVLINYINTIKNTCSKMYYTLNVYISSSNCLGYKMFFLFFDIVIMYHSKNNSIKLYYDHVCS